MPGNFTPPSIKGQQEPEADIVSVQANTPPPAQPTESHGSFGAPVKIEEPIAQVLVNQPGQGELKKISAADYKTPAFKNIAIKVGLMPGIIETFKKNLDESKSNVELGFYQKSINTQVEILENAERTFKQIGSNGEDEATAKGLMTAVGSFMQEFSMLEQKAKKIVAEGRAKKVGAEICVPLKTEDGKPNPEAVTIIKENVGDSDVTNTKPEKGEGTTTGEQSPDPKEPTNAAGAPEQQKSFIAYQAPGQSSVTITQPNVERPSPNIPPLTANESLSVITLAKLSFEKDLDAIQKAVTSLVEAEKTGGLTNSARATILPTKESISLLAKSLENLKGQGADETYIVEQEGGLRMLQQTLDSLTFEPITLKETRESKTSVATTQEVSSPNTSPEKSVQIQSPLITEVSPQENFTVRQVNQLWEKIKGRKWQAEPVFVLTLAFSPIPSTTTTLETKTVSKETITQPAKTMKQLSPEDQEKFKLFTR
ncbi:MAG: hypothetical protein QG653_157 [Patescibacteria group bacterium]|nr:hypothetical protein [Patescibacteria group bacterium]